MEEIVQEAKQKGYVTTLLKRERIYRISQAAILISKALQNEQPWTHRSRQRSRYY